MSESIQEDWIDDAFDKIGEVITSPKIIWEWDFIGDGNTIVFHITKEVGLWKRFWTKVFFGSKWRRVNE